MQWAPGPLHSKGEIRVFLLQERLAALVVHSVCVSEYRRYTTPAQESQLDSGTTNKAFFILGGQRSGNECVAMGTSKPLSQSVVLVAHQS